MNFSKKLFTGFTATAVGISLMAGGFSVLGEEKPKQGEEIKQADVVNPGAADTDTEKVQETVPEAKKEEYKTVEEATAAKEKLLNSDIYKLQANVEEVCKKAIEMAKNAQNKGLILIRRTVKEADEKNLKDDSNDKKVLTDSLLSGFKTMMEGVINLNEKEINQLKNYESKLKEWRLPSNATAEMESLYDNLVKFAKQAEEVVAKRDAKKEEVKTVLSQIKAIDEKIAELKKANENSNSKKQETKAKETNKNQKSFNGTNNATATKKADATKIKTGVE